MTVFDANKKFNAHFCPGGIVRMICMVRTVFLKGYVWFASFRGRKKKKRFLGFIHLNQSQRPWYASPVLIEPCLKHNRILMFSFVLFVISRVHRVCSETGFLISAHIFVRFQLRSSEFLNGISSIGAEFKLLA